MIFIYNIHIKTLFLMNLDLINVYPPLLLRYYNCNTIFDNCESSNLDGKYGYEKELFQSIVNQDIGNIKRILTYYQNYNINPIFNSDKYCNYTPIKAALKFKKELYGNEIIELISNKF